MQNQLEEGYLTKDDKLALESNPDIKDNFDQVTALTAAALALFTPAECRNYVRHCGYRLTVQL